MSFKKYDRVLMRTKVGPWKAMLFKEEKEKKFITTCGFMYDECVPFEGNEYLIGTKEDIWEPKNGDVVFVRDTEYEDWSIRVFYDGSIKNSELRYYTYEEYDDDCGQYDTIGWLYCKPFKPKD